MTDGLGHTEAQLNAYYKAHPKSSKDSCFDFIACRTKVALAMYLSENMIP